MARRPAKRYRPRFHDIIADDRITSFDYRIGNVDAWRRYLRTNDLAQSRIEIRRKPGVRPSPEVRSERDSIRSWLKEDRHEDLTARLRMHVMARHTWGDSQAEIARDVRLTRLQVHRIIVNYMESLRQLRMNAPHGELEAIHADRERQRQNRRRR
jgi:hypothetical protein